MDNLLLGFLPMEMIVTDILLVARIPVAFLDKFIVCRQTTCEQERRRGNDGPGLGTNSCS